MIFISCIVLISVVEQELITLPQHMRSHIFFSVVRVAQSLVFCEDHCFSFCPFPLVIALSVYPGRFIFLDYKVYRVI
jgi:hypothetical protein